MKRLHIVGKSKDNRRLFLAKTKGAKFGSFEIPISRKLLKLIDEAEEARNSHRKAPAKARPEKEQPAPPQEPAAEIEASRPQARDAAATAAEAPRAAPGEPQIDLPIGRRTAGGREAAAAKARNAREAAAPEEPVELEPTPQERIRDRMQPRRKRPEIPARSNLTPAEIQTLIRAGRSVRTVAQLAGTSTAWIRWLAEPVEQERMGIVAQALQQRQVRARLGTSAEPLGEAVVRNLRSRGVISPDRVVEEGFSALRDGPDWKVRLGYEHRGRRLSAVWSYDPLSRQVVPVNSLATQLGWREPGGGAEGEEEPAPRPRRTRSRKRPAASSRSRSGARTRAKASRTTSKRSPARKRSTGGRNRSTTRRRG